MFKLESIENNLYFNVLTENNKIVGYLRFDVSGYYYFEQEGTGGWWDENCLRQLASILEEKNREYDKEVKNYFERNGREN